jgi:hypothetical protein
MPGKGRTRGNAGYRFVTERACAKPSQLSVMNISRDETHRIGAFVLNPMRAWPVFSEDLPMMKFLSRAVLMMIGQHTGQHIDDCGIAAMAMDTDMTAGRNHRAA